MYRIVTHNGKYRIQKGRKIFYPDNLHFDPTYVWDFISNYEARIDRMDPKSDFCDGIFEHQDLGYVSGVMVLLLKEQQHEDGPWVPVE